MVILEIFGSCLEISSFDMHMSSLSFCCLRGHSSTRTTRGKLGWEEELRERDGVMIYSIVWEHTAGAVVQNERLAGRA